MSRRHTDLGRSFGMGKRRFILGCFYCIMLCISADYAVARRPCICLSVCLSVCLSHAGIVLKWLNISSHCFTWDGHTILVFPYQTLWQYSDRDPDEGIKCRI